MPITNWGAQATTYNIGSNISNNYIQYCAIGSGSGTFAATETTLINERTRAFVTGSPNFTTARKVEFQFDFTASTMSGLGLTEIGFVGSYPALQGSTWQIERFPSQSFNGTQELQVVDIIEVLRG